MAMASSRRWSSPPPTPLPARRPASRRSRPSASMAERATVKAAETDPGAAEQAKEADLEGGRMPFMQHLGELRDRVRNAAIAFVIAFLVCWGFADDIFAWLRKPLFDIWDQHSGPHVEWLIRINFID